MTARARNPCSPHPHPHPQGYAGLWTPNPSTERRYQSPHQSSLCSAWVFTVLISKDGQRGELVSNRDSSSQKGRVGVLLGGMEWDQQSKCLPQNRSQEKLPENLEIRPREGSISHNVILEHYLTDPAKDYFTIEGNILLFHSLFTVN